MKHPQCNECDLPEANVRCGQCEGCCGGICHGSEHAIQHAYNQSARIDALLDEVEKWLTSGSIYDLADLRWVATRWYNISSSTG